MMVAWLSFSAWLRGIARPLLIAAVAALGGFCAGLGVGLHYGGARVTAQVTQATEKAQAQADATTTKTIARSATTGAARETDRARLDRLFATLNDQAAHEAADPVDVCVLPADRLRRWAAANAGAADQGAATAEPDGAAQAPASAAIGSDEGPGSQPPPGGAAVPPAGQPAVPAAAVSGSA